MEGRAANGGTRDGQHVALVHDRLRDAILRGELPAGQTTSQVTLARDLDVGRTPLREALRMLQREGLVVSEPNRRVRIAELSSADAEALYVMRIALEAVAIRITVPTLDVDDVAELEGYMAQMDHYMRSDDRAGCAAPPRLPRPPRERGGRARGDLDRQLFDHAERYRRASATPRSVGPAPRRAPGDPRRGRRGRRRGRRGPARRPLPCRRSARPRGRSIGPRSHAASDDDPLGRAGGGIGADGVARQPAGGAVSSSSARTLPSLSRSHVDFTGPKSMT